jgi:hypothetical protein
MSAQTSPRFFGNAGLSSAPFGDVLLGLVECERPAVEPGATDQPMITSVEVVWACVAVGATWLAALFLAV